MGDGVGLFQEAFQPVDAIEPVLHQMEVLQADPVAVLGGLEKTLLCSGLLALSHGNSEFLVHEAILLGDLVDFATGLDTREEDKEYRSKGAGFQVGGVDVQHTLLHVHFTHRLEDKSIKGISQSIRSQGSQQQ